ncbi:hypothetical protein ART_3999 [Arthrobacter sp. PAMC 25486]|nr:hypothetical protein ART_3999 [Arthrobacter sp. PAMC 25486]
MVLIAVDFQAQNPVDHDIHVPGMDDEGLALHVVARLRRW